MMNDRYKGSSGHFISLPFVIFFLAALITLCAWASGKFENTLEPAQMGSSSMFAR